MKRDDIIQQLTEHRQKIIQLDVKSLAIFGSVARGESGPESDVDFLVEFQGRATLDHYMDLKFFLEDLLQCRVDLVTNKALKPRMRPHVQQEAIYVT